MKAVKKTDNDVIFTADARVRTTDAFVENMQSSLCDRQSIPRLTLVAGKHGMPFGSTSRDRFGDFEMMALNGHQYLISTTIHLERGQICFVKQIEKKNLVSNLIEELLITRQRIRPILDKTA
jgi:hypothetical protein